MRYQVRGIPTLLLFKGGQVVDQRVGLTSKPDLAKMLDAQIAKPVTP
jgi:thioredoxin 1